MSINLWCRVFGHQFYKRLLSNDDVHLERHDQDHCDRCGLTKMLINKDKLSIIESRDLNSLPSVSKDTLRKFILSYWSREEIVNFCKHLMGDVCQECSKVK